jgi:hypothetical protein
MSKCALRHWSGYSGTHHAGESGQHVPRHAAGELSCEGCFSGGDVIKAIAGLAAIAVTAAGAVSVGASIDERYDKADTIIQQPAERKSAESTGTPPQPTGPDSIIDQSPEGRRIVIDGASRVSACDIRSQQGELGEGVMCVHPDIFAYLGSNPADESNNNISPANVDSRKQPTSA